MKQAGGRPDCLMVQVYRGSEDLKINDVVHVVGILSHSPEMEGQDPQDADALQDAEPASASRLVTHRQFQVFVLSAAADEAT